MAVPFVGELQLCLDLQNTPVQGVIQHHLAHARLDLVDPPHIASVDIIDHAPGQIGTKVSAFGRSSSEGLPS